ECGNGHQASYAGRRGKAVTTVPGPVRLTRAWYHCGECKRGFAPRDHQLGVARATLSPGMAEVIALAGAEVSFARAAALLSWLAGLTVSARTSERPAGAPGAAAPPPGCAAAPAGAGPRHALRGGRRHWRARPRQRDRGPAGQGRGRQGRHPRGQARPAV